MNHHKSLPTVSQSAVKYSTFFLIFSPLTGWYSWQVQGWDSKWDGWEGPGCLPGASCTGSPVDGAVFLAGNGLQVREFQEAVVEVVQVQDAHQQEGRGDEYAREELSHRELF